MSPASYRAAPPRVDSLTLAHPHRRAQNDPPWPADAGHGGSHQPLGVGAGLCGADGPGEAGADGPVTAGVPAAAFWAFWKSVIA